jgi:hypothetical protein
MSRSRCAFSGKCLARLRKVGVNAEQTVAPWRGLQSINTGLHLDGYSQPYELLQLNDREERYKKQFVSVFFYSPTPHI